MFNRQSCWRDTTAMAALRVNCPDSDFTVREPFQKRSNIGALTEEPPFQLPSRLWLW